SPKARFLGTVHPFGEYLQTVVAISEKSPFYVSFAERKATNDTLSRSERRLKKGDFRTLIDRTLLPDQSNQ
ncbi:MAG: hypothetical protein KDB22_22705, partial [Planctomycetales bacterium]|nr:hypothetical protein [Planctomycetales bacterium]